MTLVSRQTPAPSPPPPPCFTTSSGTCDLILPPPNEQSTGTARAAQGQGAASTKGHPIPNGFGLSHAARRTNCFLHPRPPKPRTPTALVPLFSHVDQDIFSLRLLLCCSFPLALEYICARLPKTAPLSATLTPLRPSRAPRLPLWRPLFRSHSPVALFCRAPFDIENGCRCNDQVRLVFSAWVDSG